MRKIISVILSLTVCFVVITAYADEKGLDNSINASTEEYADMLLNFKNSNDETELTSPLEFEQEDSETFIAGETGLLTKSTEDTDVELYAATTIIDSGTCGDNLTWEVNSGGTLTLRGSGTLYEYHIDGEVPWNSYSGQIYRVNLEIVTESLCPTDDCCAFGMLYLIAELQIPEGVVEIPQSDRLFPKQLRKLILPSTYAGELSNNRLIREMCYLDIGVAENNPVYCSVDGTLFSKDRTKIVQYTKSAIEPNYVVPETVTDIDFAFYGNTFLETLTISKNVEIVNRDTYNNKFDNLGMGTDACDTQCKAVYVDSENPYFCDVDGVLYNKDMTMLIWCPPYHDLGESYYIPGTVRVIAAGAFAASHYLYILIPDGVEVLGYGAFMKSAIKKAILPQNTKAVYSACFYYCEQLEQVIIEGGETAEYGIQIFDGCSKLKTAGTIGSGCDIEFCWTEGIPAYVFNCCNSLVEITIPCTVTTIGAWAFSNCHSLREIQLPSDIVSVGHDAFLACTTLKEITIPNKIISIGYDAFYGCTSLSNIYIDRFDGSISGAPWAAPNATISYLREIHIDPIPNSHMYTGSAIMPAVSISEKRKDGTASSVLAEHEDYFVIYYDNVNAGSAKIKVNYINDYGNVANVELTFMIMPRVSNKLIIAPIPDQVCTGRAITPDPTITDTAQ